MTRNRWFVIAVVLALLVVGMPLKLRAQHATVQQQLAKDQAQIAELENRIASGEATQMDCGTLGMLRTTVRARLTPPGTTREQRRAANERELKEWRDREPPDACAQFSWAQTLPVEQKLEYLADRAPRFADSTLYLEGWIGSLWQAGEMEEARRRIEAFLERHPTNPRALKLQVQHYHSLGDEDQTRRALDQLLNADPGDVHAARLWFLNRAEGMDTAELQRSIAKLFERHPFRAGSSLLCREIARATSDSAYSLAMDCFERVLATDLSAEARQRAQLERAQVIVFKHPERFTDLATDLSPENRRLLASHALGKLLTDHRCREAAALFEDRIDDDLGGRDVVSFAAYCSWNPAERAFASELTQRLRGRALEVALGSWPENADPSTLLQRLPVAVLESPESSSLRRAVHRFLIEHGSVDQQIAHYESWVQVDPGDAWLRKEFLIDLYWSDATEEALRLAGQYFAWLESLDDQSSTDYTAGMLAVELGLVEQAATFLDRSQAQGGRRRDSVRLASRVALLQQDLPRAAELLRESMFLDGGGAVALYGEVLWMLDQAELLPADLEELYQHLSDTPGDAPQGSRASWVASQLKSAGYYAEAVHYLRTIEREELTARDREQLQLMQRQLGDLDAAIVSAREAAAKAPTNSQRHSELVRLLLADKRYAEAIAAAEAALATFSHPYPIFQLAIGEALLELGEAERATEILTLIARESDFRRVRDLLRRAQAAAGRQRPVRSEANAPPADIIPEAPVEARPGLQAVAHADRLLAGSDGHIDVPAAIQNLMPAADEGDDFARLRLLTMDQTGSLSLNDEQRSLFAELDLEAIRLAAHESSTAQALLGTAHLVGAGPVAADPDAARQYFQRAADQAPWAGHNLGWMYEQGVGIPVDMSQARHFYGLAASLGNARSMDALARIDLELEPELDLSRVERLLRSAAERGELIAIYRLGRLLLFGEHGMPLDVTRGLTLLTRAAEAGMEEARETLAWVYTDGTAGVEPDAQQAALWEAKLSEEPDEVTAQQAARWALAIVGSTDVQDARELLWFIRAADVEVRVAVEERLQRAAIEGSREAAGLRAYLITELLPTEQARVEGIHSLREAAASGSKLAMYFLAEDLADGIRTEADAIRWWATAADADHRESQHALGWRYLQGAGVDKEVNRGFSLLEKAANGGYLRSILTLARCYDLGNCGAPVNESRAVQWYRMAAELGEASAVGWLRVRGLL